MWRHWDSLSHKALGEGCCGQWDVFICVNTCTKNKPQGKAVCGPGALGRAANAELFQAKLPGRIPAGNAWLLPKRVEMLLGWEVPVRSLDLLLLGSVKIRIGSFPNVFSQSVGGGRSTSEHPEVLSCWDDTFLGHLLPSRSSKADLVLKRTPG